MAARTMRCGASSRQVACTGGRGGSARGAAWKTCSACTLIRDGQFAVRRDEPSARMLRNAIGKERRARRGLDAAHRWPRAPHTACRASSRSPDCQTSAVSAASAHGLRKTCSTRSEMREDACFALLNCRRIAPSAARLEETDQPRRASAPAAGSLRSPSHCGSPLKAVAPTRKRTGG